MAYREVPDRRSDESLEQWYTRNGWTWPPKAGPYSEAEKCTSCNHQSFFHGAGSPLCSFMVAEHEACGCRNLRFAETPLRGNGEQRITEAMERLRIVIANLEACVRGDARVREDTLLEHLQGVWSDVPSSMLP